MKKRKLLQLVAIATAFTLAILMMWQGINIPMIVAIQ
jgi:hypothetical protein